MPASPQFTYGFEPESNGLIKTVVGPVLTVTNTYETNRNVLESKENATNVANGVISKYVYNVNNIGQRESVTTSGSAFENVAPAYNWSYNPRGELEEADDISSANNDRAYQFDGIGNRKKTVDGLLGDLPTAPNYTANALNQYEAIESLVPDHDDDGNMTEGPLPVDPGNNASMEWNAENRLVEVIKVDGTKVTYSYDSIGRRIRKATGSTTYEYLYDGWNLISQYKNGNATPTKTYVWGKDISGSMQGAGGVGGLLSETKTGTLAETHYATYDGNGNISEYLDASGGVVEHLEYDAFGNLTGGGGNSFEFKFSTKLKDTETGLYYYGFRHYGSLTGRWLSRDPIEERGGVNLMSFVNNSSTNAVDRVGLETEFVTDPQNFSSVSVESENEIHVQHGDGEPVVENVSMSVTHRVAFGESTSPSISAGADFYIGDKTGRDRTTFIRIYGFSILNVAVTIDPDSVNKECRCIDSRTAGQFFSGQFSPSEEGMKWEYRWKYGYDIDIYIQTTEGWGGSLSAGGEIFGGSFDVEYADTSVVKISPTNQTTRSTDWYPANDITACRKLNSIQRPLEQGHNLER